MGLIGDVERTAGDVVHVGQDVVADVGQGVAEVGAAAVADVAAMLGSLRSYLTDVGLGDLVTELAQLAEQADQLRRRLCAAAGSAHWSGAAADGFEKRAGQRRQQLGELVAALDSAHEAAAAVHAVANIF